MQISVDPGQFHWKRAIEIRYSILKGFAARGEGVGTWHIVLNCIVMSETLQAVSEGRTWGTWGLGLGAWT